MKRVYFDNGATSYPKAPGVGDAVKNYIENVGGNINRGVYRTAVSAENTVFETRELISEMFGYGDYPENVVFTKNITESLNTVIKGLLKSGDRVIVSSMEHNAVMRPLNSMKNYGVDFIRMKCNENGELDIAEFEKKLANNNVKAVIMTAASNVCGTIMPIEEIGRLCRKYKAIFVLDAAQAAGVINLDMEKMNIDILCFTGHKSLLGPQGTGGFVIRKEIVEKVDLFIEGGTGSLSDTEIQPSYMPDKYESGTMNIPGIFGLNASLKYILDTGIDNIHKREMELTERFIKKVKEIDGIRIIGKKDTENRTSVVSIDFENMDNGIVSHTLDKEYGIATRSGMHCAPSAHKTLDTFPRGTVRFSFGYFNTEEEIDYAVEAIKNIIK